MNRLRDERGGVLVMAAVLIPLFLLLTALVVDAGTWFTHKRQLQNRADAGALAAGVQYAAQWAACGDAAQKATVAAAIDAAARRYAGDPQQTGSLYNTDVTDQSRVNVEINSTSSGFDANTSWNDTGINGTGPCDPHPTADAFSPANSYWVDVKVKEVNQRTLFGAFGLDLLRNRAQARVELKTVAAGKGFLPIALPDQDIRQAEIRYYRYCGTPNPELLATVPLRPLGTDYQSVSGTTLWGPTLNNTTGGTPIGVDLPIPSDKTCSGSRYNVYMPVRAEVRIAGVDPKVVDIDNFTCTELAAMRYTDCWGQVSDFSVDGDNPRTEPWFHEVTLSGGSSGSLCSADAYFAKPPVGVASCTYNVSVRVDWNDLANNPPAGRQFGVSLGGALNAPGVNTFNGVWTGTATNSVLGPSEVTLTWTCTDQDPAHPGNPNKRVNCPGTNGGASVPVHSTFLGDRANSGLLELVRTSRNPQMANGQPGAELHWYPAPQIPNQKITVYPTVGLEGGLYVGQRRVLRAPHCKNNTNSDNCDIDTSSPNTSQSIDCEPNTGGQGHDFVMFANGCRPWYGFNLFDDPTWWPCPDKNGVIAEPNSRTTPWFCVVKAPGFSPPVIADGIAAAIGNCSNLNPNSCQRYACTNPNYYDPSKPNQWALQGGEPSKRVVFLFIVPYGAYKNTGPQDTMPVLNFAAFYVTGWQGKGQGNNNPCNSDPDGPNMPGLADEITNGGDIVGYFVDYTVPDAPGDPNSVCEIDQLRPCTPVLVR